MQHQQPNVIQNPKLAGDPQTKGPEMTDQDRLNDCLSTEKWLTDNFNVMVREASHRELFQDLMVILNETHQCAREFYNVMFEEGYYKLEVEEQQKIQQSQQQFQQYAQTQFPQGQLTM